MGGIELSMGKEGKPLTRTVWAERYVEALVSMPFVSEFVFRSPQTVGSKQREIADLLITQGETNLVFSQKCQEDPTSRSPKKNMLWVLKEAKAGVSQLQGGIKALLNGPFWCEHPRRGHVTFDAALSQINEGIVLVETFKEVDLSQYADSLPLSHNGVDISYLSVNDFLNLAHELRSVPELLHYLKARRCLSEADQRVLGAEKDIFSTYLLNERSLGDCLSRKEARILVRKRRKALSRAISFKKDNDVYCKLLEQVAHELSTRDPNLPNELVGLYEPIGERSGYLKMQLAIADLQWVERTKLGKAFFDTIREVRARANLRPDFAYRAEKLDSKPDWVFVVGSARSMNRAVLVNTATKISHGAIGYYNKTQCLSILDREGQGYEVVWLKHIGEPSEEQKDYGRTYFNT